jgi:hypothetical protein
MFRTAILFNDHFYQLVGVDLSFNTALSNAASLTYLGRPGHLVTITSVEENTFVINLAAGNNFWMAGTDTQQEGVWRWVAGPENGAIINPLFWAPGQPDNSGNEDYLGYLSGAAGWNDWPASGYSLATIVEFECLSNPSASGYCSRMHACVMLCPS